MFNWLFGKKKKVEEMKKVMIPSKPLQKYATPKVVSNTPFTPPVRLGNRYSGNSSVDPIDHTDAIDAAVNLATELAYQHHHISRLLNDPEPVMSSDTTPDTTPDTTASYSAPDTSSSYDSGSSSSSYDSGSSSSSYDSGSSYSGSDSSYSSSGGDF